MTALRRKRQRVVSQEETFDLYDIDLSDEDMAAVGGKDLDQGQNSPFEENVRDAKNRDACDNRRPWNFKNSRRWRTCADDGDTSREIWPKIVCEARAPSARFWVKFCRRGIQRGKQARQAIAVRDCCPF